MAYKNIPLVNPERDDINLLIKFASKSPEVQVKMRTEVEAILDDASYKNITSIVAKFNETKMVTVKGYQELLQALTTIQDKANSFYETYKFHNPTSVNSIRKILIEGFDTIRDLSLATREKLDQVLTKQEKIAGLQSLNENRNKFEEYLKQIEALHPRTSQPIYICHARNFLPNETWLHKILENIYPQVKQTYRALKWEEKDCDNPVQYRRGFPGGKMIFFMTPSFKTEVEKKLGHDEKITETVHAGLLQEQASILPIIIGTPATSVPQVCEKWKETAQLFPANYLDLLKLILSFSYQEMWAKDPQKKEQFDAIWAEIEKLAPNQTLTTKSSTSFFGGKTSARSYIESTLTKEELMLISTDLLMKATPMELRRFCETAQQFRNDGSVENYRFLSSPNKFMAGAEALVSRGMEFKKFLAFDTKKQIALATNQFSWLMVDTGVDCKQMCELELDELNELFRLAKEKITGFKPLDSEDAEELTAFINSKTPGARFSV